MNSIEPISYKPATSATHFSSPQLEYWPISRLVPYIRNPRKNDHAVDQMVVAIETYGFKVPIIARSNGEVVDGHLRLKAALRMGLTEVPVILADDLSPAQIKAFRLLANRSASWALWDDDLLRQELEDLRLDDFDLSLTGFDNDEILEILSGEETTNSGQTDEDSVPETDDVPRTLKDEVWLLGPHKVMCGDSTKLDHVHQLMAGDSADVLLTDPPYNVAYGGDGGNAANKNKVDGGKRNTQTILNDDMPDEDFRKFLVDAFTAAASVMKPGAAFYIWHSDSEGYNFRGACKDAGLTIRQCLIWKKSSLVLGRQDYQWIHEPCLYGWKDGAAHLWNSDRKQTTMLEFDKPSRNLEHPTIKPLAIFEYQLLNSTKKGQIALDTFGGSGTTLIACEKHGRTARLMELDPKYCDVIIRRWQAYSGKKASRQSDGIDFDQAASSSSLISQ
jgi:DNA modification methylase